MRPDPSRAWKLLVSAHGVLERQQVVRGRINEEEVEGVHGFADADADGSEAGRPRRTRVTRGRKRQRDEGCGLPEHAGII